MNQPSLPCAAESPDMPSSWAAGSRAAGCAGGAPPAGGAAAGGAAAGGAPAGGAPAGAAAEGGAAPGGAATGTSGIPYYWQQWQAYSYYEDHNWERLVNERRKKRSKINKERQAAKADLGTHTEQVLHCPIRVVETGS